MTWSLGRKRGRMFEEEAMLAVAKTTAMVVRGKRWREIDMEEILKASNLGELSDALKLDGYASINDTLKRVLEEYKPQKGQ